MIGRRGGCIDIDPKMEIVESLGASSSSDDWHFTFGTDVIDSLGPGSCDLDEHIILEYLSGFEVNLPIDTQDLKLVAVPSAAVTETTIALHVGSYQDFAVDLLANFRRTK